jgi:hypothetical protein
MVHAATLFLMKRTRVVKIAFAIITLMFLSGTLSGFMLAQVMSATQSQGKLSNYGTVKTVGVGIYEDAGLTTPMTAINWGALDPGSEKTITVYVRNEANTAVTLSMVTSNWIPSTASNYITLSWNYNGQTVAAGGSVAVTLTLTISSNVNGISSFSFDIIITGTG